MRRFLLTLTLFSVPCWSLPAQQPAQPPMVVKVEMPPTNPLVHLVELVVPGIIGAGIAFLGVWWTNKRNAAENAANREHQFRLEFAKDKIAAEATSRDSRWAFRKDVYVNLITATTDMLAGSSALLNSVDKHATFQQHVLPSLTTFLRQAGLAELATADPVPTLVSAAVNEIMRIDSAITEFEQIRTLAAHLYSLRTSLQEAGRKDLWEMPEIEAQAKAST